MMGLAMLAIVVGGAILLSRVRTEYRRRRRQQRRLAAALHFYSKGNTNEH